MASFRTVTINIRDMGISQEVTSACDSLVQVLNRVVNMLSAVSAFATAAVKSIDDKIANN